MGAFAASGPEQDVLINIAAIGDNQLLAGIAGFRWRLLSLFVISAGTVTLTWGSGLAGAFVAASGAIPLIANAQLPLLLNEGGWYTGGAGLAANFKLGGAIALTGVAKFQQVL